MLKTTVQIDGNLVIQWHERGACDVSFVPAGLATARPVPVRRLPDLVELEQLLRAIGLPGGRVTDVLGSPYVLQSVPVRVDRATASRLGLVSVPPYQRALDRLVRVVSVPARLARRAAGRLPQPRP